jgi:hypothetical protein
MGKRQPLPPEVVYVHNKSTDTRAVDEAFNYLFNKFIQQQKKLTKE